MNYNDIKQRVYDILDMPVQEAVRMGYASRIHRIFNEATFTIAHSLLPNLRQYKISVTEDKLPVRIDMPPDFISFANEQDAYVNGKNFILIDFIDTNGLILSGKECGNIGIPYTYTDDAGKEIKTKLFNYTVYYNALYPEIVDGGKKYQMYKFVDTVNAEGYEVSLEPTEVIHNNSDTSFQWPKIIGHLVPHYIVGQLLARDDKVRSIEELNLFETLSAKVNVERNERQREYRSVRGWY